MVVVMVRPGLSHSGGVRAAPTPPHVPVAITREGSSVAEQHTVHLDGERYAVLSVALEPRIVRVQVDPYL